MKKSLSSERTLVKREIKICVGTERPYHRDKMYIKLAASDVARHPSKLQIHALKVLSFTFSLLSLPSGGPQSLPERTTLLAQPGTRLDPNHVPAHVNDLLRDLGLPAIRVRNNERGNIIVNGVALAGPRFPFRQLATPLFLLLLRTALLVYFVSPTKKPIFGALLIAYVLYEAWGPIRQAFLDPGGPLAPPQERRNEVEVPAQPVAVNMDAPVINPNGNHAPAAPDRLQNLGVGNGRNRAAPINRPGLNADNISNLLDQMASFNIDIEEAALNARTLEAASPPTLLHCVGIFVNQFIWTLHPAYWNRRRAILRRREARIREEATAGEQTVEPLSENASEVEKREFEHKMQIHERWANEQARRPQWILNYIERVRRGDWPEE